MEQGIGVIQGTGIRPTPGFSNGFSLGFQRFRNE
jgi:hypothetical protein